MSKLKKKDEEENKKKDSAAVDPPAVLTPWQKENLEYLKKHGDQPSWQPELIENEKYTSEAETEQIESEEVETTDDSPPVMLKELPKSESFADKLPMLKQERRHRLIRRLSFLIGLFGIAALGMLYYISPLSKLGTVVVTGNENINTEQIVAASKFKTGEALWPQYFERDKASKAITEEFPRAKTANISLSRFNQLVISIKERSIVAYMLENGDYYPILDNGVTLTEKVKQPEGNFPILSGFKDQAILLRLLQAYHKIPAEIRSNISEIHATPSAANPYLITLYMNDKNQIIASIKDVAEKIVYYPKIAAMMSENGVVDMEAGAYSYKYGTSGEQNTEEGQQQNQDDDQ